MPAAGATVEQCGFGGQGRRECDLDKDQEVRFVRVCVLGGDGEAEIDQEASRYRPVLAETRRAVTAELLRDTGAVTVSELEERFGISSMTARRDLADLERQGLARRTHGGAVLPRITVHEDAFTQRLGEAAKAKERLAVAAVELLEPRETLFLDSSTTAYFAARRILDVGIGVTVLTNSVPVMQLISMSDASNVELVGIGGLLRQLTRSFVGPHALATVARHYADRVLLSATGVTHDGVMTDADSFEAEVKAAMIAHAQDSILLVDERKLGARGFARIASVAELAMVLVTGATERDVEGLAATGVSVRCVP